METENNKKAIYEKIYKYMTWANQDTEWSKNFNWKKLMLDQLDLSKQHFNSKINLEGIAILTDLVHDISARKKPPQMDSFYNIIFQTDKNENFILKIYKLFEEHLNLISKESDTHNNRYLYEELDNCPSIKFSVGPNQENAMFSPPVWKENESPLEALIPEVLQYLAKMGVETYNDKIKSFYYVLSNDFDRKDFNRQFISRMTPIDCTKDCFENFLKAFCIRYDKKHLKTVDSHLENLYSRKATQLNGETIEQYYKRLKTMYTLAHGDHINNLENLRSYCKIFVSGLFNNELRSRLMEEEYVLIHREGNMDKLLKQALEIHCRIIEANEQTE